MKADAILVALREEERGGGRWMGGAARAGGAVLFGLAGLAQQERLQILPSCVVLTVVLYF